MIQSTSLEAFYSIIGELGQRQQEIFNAIQKYKSVSNLDLSRLLQLPINSVTPRVKELRDKGLVVCNGYKIDRITNRRMKTWRVVNETE